MLSQVQVPRCALPVLHPHEQSRRWNDWMMASTNVEIAPGPFFASVPRSAATHARLPARSSAASGLPTRARHLTPVGPDFLGVWANELALPAAGGSLRWLGLALTAGSCARAE